MSAGEATPKPCTAPQCDFIFCNNPIPVVAGIVENSGEIILVRGATWTEGMFGLVTGFVEPLEDPLATMGREVTEELSVSVHAMTWISAYPFEQLNQLLLTYHVQSSGEITLSDELAEFKRIPINKLKPWPFGTGHAVRDWLNLRNISHAAN
jgi:NAD+ diphosphatase